MRVLSVLIAALAVCPLAIGRPALAGQAVTLKADTASADSVVTLGDLFDGAGGAGHLPVANRTGSSVVLDAAAVQLAARRAGLDWANAEGLHKIVVHAGVAAQAAAGPTGRGNVEVLTYTRSLSTGEIVQPTDLAWVKAAAAPADSPNDADMVIGQAAKRPLRAGAPVLPHDVGSAQVIKSGDVVTVNYEAEGIKLTLDGKSMGSAGVGDSLAVQNTQSKKIVQAIVTGPGQAVVGPAADEIKSARSRRYAAR
jgi:flagellar basal body P-ring formation protein FlgA